jgi:hypothetical protein
MTSDRKAPSDARWEELVEAEACGSLSAAERGELERLAANSEERQWERRRLADVPKLAATQTEPREEDSVLIERVLLQHTQKRRGRILTFGRAAALLIPLSAAAAYMIRAGTPQEPSAVSSSQRTVDPPALTASAKQTPPADVEEKAAPDTTDSTKPPAIRPSFASASELLNRAQKARAARNYPKAAQEYRQLLRLYPASGEASVARLALAQLHLAEGNATAALAGFDEYQRAGGELSQEAHYGKIQALHALGRTVQEHAEIRQFLARYPRSLQAAALRRRLGATRAPE